MARVTESDQTGGPGRGPGEGGPAAAAELLALRLRVAGLERDVALARDAVAGRTALLDALHHHRVWRAVEQAQLARRALDPDVLAARGVSGAGPGEVRVPLAGLPLTGADASPAWTDALTVGGVSLPAAPADPPSALRFRLAGLTGGARVRAFAALRPAAWLQNRGGARFTIALLGADGATLVEATRDVDPTARPEDRRWLPLELALPPLAADAEAVLELRTSLPPDVTPDFCWALWGDPVLLVGDGAAPRSPWPATSRRGVGLLRAAAATVVRERRTRPAPAVAAGDAPLISLLMPVHDPPPALLELTLGSVLGQEDAGGWQLCVVDDGSTDPAVRAVLDRAAQDERITVARHDRAQGISAATNRALQDARGAYVATLDHDDLLTPDAMGAVRAALAADPAIDVLYSDNDKVADGARFAPSLKPGWSPERLRACMYTLHLGVYRRALVEAVGGWRPALDGAQDHDLLLRLSERTGRITHLPRTLYSWRAHAGSAALGDGAKPLAYGRALAAVDEHLQRIGLPARAEVLPTPGRYRVVHEPPHEPVAILLPLPADLEGDASLADRVAAVVEALLGGAPAELEVVAAVCPATAAAARALDVLDARVTVVEAADTTWGALAQAALAATAARTVVLLEELARPTSAGWLAELTGPLRADGVVASSPLTVDEDGRVLQAGLVLQHGVPLAVHAGAAPDGEDVPPDLTMVTDRSAAGGVVAVDRARLAAAPLDAVASHLALADLTARLTARGGRVVCSPHASWQVLGAPRTAVTDLAELHRFAAAHGTRRDPYVSPRVWPDSGAQLVPRDLQLTGTLRETIAVIGGLEPD